MMSHKSSSQLGGARRPGLEAKNLRAALGLSVLWLAISGCGGCKESFDQGFKSSFEKSFVESCAKSASNGGGQAASIRAMCECAGKYLVDHNDSLALTKMSTRMDSEETSQTFKAAIEACQATSQR